MNLIFQDQSLFTGSDFSDDDDFLGDDPDDDEDDEDSEDSESEDSEDDINGEDLANEEQEKKICEQIGKVLYENSWTGEMISSSAEFSQREFNALLDVGGVRTDAPICNLVWNIIFYSQKKTQVC